MPKTFLTTLILLVMLVPAEAGERIDPLLYDARTPRQSGLSKWWKISVAVLATANAADVHSSWGRLEANPALAGPNGRFGMQGIAIKSLIAAGVVTAQYVMLRNHPKASKYGVITNFAMAGVLSAAAVSNYQRHWGVPRQITPLALPTSSQR